MVAMYSVSQCGTAMLRGHELSSACNSLQHASECAAQNMARQTERARGRARERERESERERQRERGRERERDLRDGCSNRLFRVLDLSCM